MNFFFTSVHQLFPDKATAYLQLLNSENSWKAPKILHQLKTCIFYNNIVSFQKKIPQSTKFKTWLLQTFKQHSKRKNFINNLKPLGLHDDYFKILHSIGVSKTNPQVKTLYVKHCKIMGPKKHTKILSFLSYLEQLQNISQIPDFTQCGRLSPQDAMTFCTRVTLGITARKVLVLITGYSNCKHDLEQKLQKRLHSAKSDKAYHRLCNALQITDHTELKTMTNAKMLEHLVANLTTKSAQGFILLKSQLITLNKNETVEFLQRHLPFRFTKINKFDKLVHENPQMNHYLTRMIKTTRSNFTPQRKSQYKSIIAGFVEFIHQYTKHNTLNWFLQNLEQIDFMDLCIQYIQTRRVCQTRIKSARQTHSGKNAAAHFITFLKKTVQINLKLNVVDVLANIPNSREPANSQQRREFKDEEIERMLNLNKNHPRNTLIITILREIGLRIQSLCCIKYHMLFDECHTPKHHCRVPEKGNVYRSFIAGENLKEKMQLYRTSFWNQSFENKDFYIFNPHKNTPLATSTVSHMLKQTAQKARVTVPMHAHAFRHTIVGKLIQCGNSIELVSKFMNHKNIKTTQKHYYVSTVNQLHKTMQNPFTTGFSKKKQRDETMELEYKLMRLKKQKLHKILQTIVADGTKLKTDNLKQILQVCN
jgi:site-specific recombinase XerD